MHPALEKQLRNVGANGDSLPTFEQWTALLARISVAYRQADQDRGTLERSIALSSHETRELSASVATEQDRLWVTIASMGDGVCVLDASGRIEIANPAAESVLGTSSDALAGRALVSVVSGADDDEAGLARLRQALEVGGSCRSDDARFRTATGEWVPVSFVLTPMQQSDARAGSVLIFSDIRTRKAAEEALRESESQLRAIFETAAMAIVRVSPDGSVADCNRAFGDMLGYAREEIVGKDLFGFFHPDDAPIARSGFTANSLSSRNGAEYHGERRYLHRDGSVVWVMHAISFVRRPDGVLLFAIGMLENTTGRKNLELSLRQAQKLEAVGQLAAGIAHEINTPVQFVSDSVHFVRDAVGDLLGVIRAYGELREAAAGAFPDAAARTSEAEESADVAYLSEQLPKALERALDGLDRVATIVRGMKAFAHPDRKDMAAASLNDALSATLTIARNEYKYVAEVETQFGELPHVVCHVGELNQVFLNIIVNASHAIGDVVRGTEEKGRIRIRTWLDGDCACVSIADTGAGIPEAIRHRIFDPFFTTKEVGRGTGQGLAIARSVIVDKHHGQLTFDSQPGQGTTFTIRLPLRPPAQKGAEAA